MLHEIILSLTAQHPIMYGDVKDDWVNTINCVKSVRHLCNYFNTYLSDMLIYDAFLDASKAFDRLDFWLLFDKFVKKTCASNYY